MHLAAFLPSQAMLRYVAMKGNLWGQTPEESALVDMVAEGIKDARGRWAAARGH